MHSQLFYDLNFFCNKHDLNVNIEIEINMFFSKFCFISLFHLGVATYDRSNLAITVRLNVQKHQKSAENIGKMGLPATASAETDFGG